MTAVKTYSCSSHKKLPAVVLVGNKCDVNDDERKVPYARGKDLADKLGVPFFETSAKSEPGGINVRVCPLFKYLYLILSKPYQHSENNIRI